MIEIKVCIDACYSLDSLDLINVFTNALETAQFCIFLLTMLFRGLAFYFEFSN